MVFTFGASYEERTRLMQREQATEIQITPIHHVESPCLEGQSIQHVDFVGLAIRDVDESRNIAAQVQQGMQSDRRLAGANGAHGNSDRHMSMVVSSSA